MLDIIITLLSLTNVMKYLQIFILQKISLYWCYILAKSILILGTETQSSLISWTMINVYGQICPSPQNYYQYQEHLCLVSL